MLLALVACLFVVSSIGQLARHLPSAGGFATSTPALAPVAADRHAAYAIDGHSSPPAARTPAHVVVSLAGWAAATGHPGWTDHGGHPAGAALRGYR